MRVCKAVGGIAVLLLGGCAGPAISQMNESSLTVLRHPWNSEQQIQAEAARGCALYGKTPVPVSEYSMAYQGKFVLFGCKGPNEVKAVGQPGGSGSFLTCYLPNGTNVQTNADDCLKLGGGINPPAIAAAPAPVVGTGDAWN